jgi:hypothetical protein
MKNKSNIVIKLKYPVSGQETDQNVPQAKIITHWHIQRIVAALGLLIVMLVTLLYFLLRESPEKPTEPLPTATTAANLPPINAGIPANAINPQIITPTPTKPSETKLISTKITKLEGKKKKPRVNTKQKKKTSKKQNRH